MTCRPPKHYSQRAEPHYFHYMDSQKWSGRLLNGQINHLASFKNGLESMTRNGLGEMVWEVPKWPEVVWEAD